MEETNPISPISLVHNIFINFFGEENVDLQGQVILVHFPKVTVSNENDRSIDITHLWVKVKLSLDGTIEGTFQMIRSELTSEQFKVGYSHSHIPHINSVNYKEWQTPCLGTGPINHTIASISRQFSEEMWNMFCLELSKYVTVESLTGVPYIRLESVNSGDPYYIQEIDFPLAPIPTPFTVDNPDIISAFMSVILEKKPFKFNYANGSYGIAMSEKELLIVLSNLFIEYYNSLPAEQQLPKETLIDLGVISRGKCVNNKLYYVYPRNGINTTDYRALTGEELFTFKGNTIKFNIIQVERAEEEDPNLSIFLKEDIVRVIIDRILKTVNNKYGRPTEEINPSGEIHRYI